MAWGFRRSWTGAHRELLPKEKSDLCMLMCLCRSKDEEGNWRFPADEVMEMFISLMFAGNTT